MSTLGSWLDGSRPGFSLKEFWCLFRETLKFMQEDLSLGLTEDEDQCVVEYRGEFFKVKAFAAGTYIEPEDTVSYLKKLSKRKIRPEKINFHPGWIEVWFWENAKGTKRVYKAEIFSYSPYLDDED